MSRGDSLRSIESRRGPRTQSLRNETLQEGRSHPNEEYTEDQDEENNEVEREARAGAGDPDADNRR